MLDLENIQSREELIRILKPRGIGIEIGVQQGIFSKHILENCEDLKLYLLDCWDHQSDLVYKDISNLDNNIQAQYMINTISNTLFSFKNVRIIKGYSDEFVNLFQDNFFDFIYIDANHAYKPVKNDLIKWFPKLKTKGLFSGHDYLNGNDGWYPTEFGVKQAVDEFAKENNLKVYSTKEELPWKTWFLFKD